RADALLMGSFLWSDVLVGSSVYQEIAHFEHKLLQEYEPIMIGVEDIAMPGVKQRTRFIGLPWFCDPYNGRSNNISGETYRKQVLVTGGGTNVLGSILEPFAAELAADPRFQVFVDSKLHEANAELESFSFLPIDFM